jgi:predicted DNA-binding transcriptional regulator AlpA
MSRESGSATYERVLGISEVALMCGVTTKTVCRWLSKGRFPAPIQAIQRGRLRWRQSTIDLWLESRIRGMA